MQKNRSVPDVQIKRKTWIENIAGAKPEHQIMKEQLIPSLEKDDVVIMDNMRSHHAKIVTELLNKAGISYMYLPPYSPDLNPIEKMWSKMKSILRKRKIRIASELPEVVKAALDAVSTNDCRAGTRQKRRNRFHPKQAFAVCFP